MSKIRFFLAILFLISPICWANQVVYFEPKETTFTGVITYLTFPGPPNYQNIKKGDQAEKGPYLVLKKPVDIDLAPNAEKTSYDSPTKNVQIIQLVILNDDDWKYIKKGNNVEIIGTLSSSITGHHHARALLDVKNVKVITNQNIRNNSLHVSDEDKPLLKDQED